MKRYALLLLLLALILQGCAGGPPKGLEQIETIVVVYAENRSFDHLYGMFPGAEGIANATAEQKTQLDHDGTPLPKLPPVYVGGKPSAAFPDNLPNGPFRIDLPPVSRRMDEQLPNPIHAYYQNREQIAGGANNRFVAMSNVGGWVMGYFDGSKMKMWSWARQYTLADHFFMGAYGGSYLNHLWLVCACTPKDVDAPASQRAQVDERGNVRKRPDSPASVMQGPVHLFDGRVSPDGYTVNTTQPPYQPSGIPPAAGGDAALADPARHPLAPLREKTIGDTLSAKGIAWAWYSGGWSDATRDGRQDPREKRTVIYSNRPGSQSFQPHHQPFNYFERFAPGKPDREQHLKDYADFVAAIDKGALPPVSFYKPVGRLNQHPGYTDILTGDEHLNELLLKLQKSPQWKRMVVIITYDENGGFWDHAPPPRGPGWSDRWGPGTRIPTIVVSPFARRGHVDKTIYDTTSILKLITRRFGLEPLPGVRANVGDLSNALAF